MKEPRACVIRANHVEIRSYDATVSPDYTGSDNVGYPNRWDLVVGLQDFPLFAQSLHSGGPSCHDFNNDGSTDLIDFAIFCACFGKFCTP